MNIINLNGNIVNLGDLRQEVTAAISQSTQKNYAQTVLALLNLIEKEETESIPVNIDNSVPNDFISPNWKAMNRVHEWKNYISEEIQALWDSFSLVQKLEIAKEAQHRASQEDWE